MRANYPPLLSAALGLLCDHTAALFGSWLGSNSTISYMHGSAVLQLERSF